MEDNQKDLVGMIRKAGTQQRTIGFKCPYVSDFIVDITFANKIIMTQIRERCTKIEFDTKTKQREEKLDEDKLRNEYARVIIKNWKGLTARKLREFIPTVTFEENEGDRNIPYTKEVAIAILEVSMEFENWIATTAGEVSNYRPVETQKKEEYENLEE